MSCRQCCIFAIGRSCACWQKPRRRVFFHTSGPHTPHPSHHPSTPPPPLAGAYVVLPQRTMSIVAPDLSKCQLKPYVAGKSLPRGQRVPVWGGADKAEGGPGELR